MNFIRKIINSNGLEKVLSLPDEFKNQNLEILILSLKENTQSEKNLKASFNPEDFSGKLKLNNIKNKIDSIRNE